LNIKNNFNIPFKVDSLGGILNQKLQKLYSTNNIFIECNDANILYALNRRNKYQCMLVSDLDSVGVQDVFRFGLDGIVSNFKKMDSGLTQHLIDSAKKVVVYGQISPRDYRSVDYKNIYGVQIDNPIAAVKYFRY
jgi:hypothetical protein